MCSIVLTNGFAKKSFQMQLDCRICQATIVIDEKDMYNREEWSYYGEDPCFLRMNTYAECLECQSQLEISGIPLIVKKRLPLLSSERREETKSSNKIIQFFRYLTG